MKKRIGSLLLAGLLVSQVLAVEIKFAEGSTEGDVVVPKNSVRAPDSEQTFTGTSTEIFEVDYTPRFTTGTVSGQDARSFYADGQYSRQDLIMNLNHQSADGQYLRASVGTLYTDDPILRQGGPTVRFPSAYVELGKANKYDLRVGQVPVYFSRYSFLRQVDGLRAQVHFPDDHGRWSLQGVMSRTQTPRGFDRYRQYAHGIRLSRELQFDKAPVQSLTLGLNNTWTSDQGTSLTLNQSDTLAVSDGRVSTVDVALQFDNGLQLEGEYGLSDLNVSGSQSVPAQGDYKGHAGRIAARYFQGSVSGGVEYERVSPGFRSNVGAAAFDLERINAYGGWSISPEVRVDASWRSSLNNLGGQLPASFKMRGSTASLRLTPWAQSENTKLSPLALEIAHNNSLTQLGAFSDNNTDELAFTLSYYQGPLGLSLSHRTRETTDRVNPFFDRKEDIQNVAASYRIKFHDDFVLTPSLGLNFSSAENIAAQTTAQNDNLTYGVSGEIAQKWRFDYAQNVVQTLNPGFGFGSRDSLNIFRRASVNYLPWGRDKQDLSLGLQWADRRLSDTLPGTTVDSSELTAIIRRRF